MTSLIGALIVGAQNTPTLRMTSPMTSATYHARSAGDPRSQFDKCAVVNPRHPAFDGSIWRKKPRRIKPPVRAKRAFLLEPIILAKQTTSCTRSYCRGGRYACEQLDGVTCWKYDVDELAVRNNKPLRCDECLSRRGHL
jgi:hypothetical protein